MNVIEVIYASLYVHWSSGFVVLTEKSTVSYMRVGILHIPGKHFHDRIISLRWEVCAHNTSLIPPLFTEAKKVIGHIFECKVCRFRLFLRFWYWILELFRQWYILFYVLFHTNLFSEWYSVDLWSQLWQRTMLSLVHTVLNQMIWKLEAI